MSCPHCWIVEPVDGRPTYVYRCGRCGECYACGHRLLKTTGRRWWVCRDGTPRRGFDGGLPVPPQAMAVFR